MSGEQGGVNKCNYVVDAVIISVMPSVQQIWACEAFGVWVSYTPNGLGRHAGLSLRPVKRVFFDVRSIGFEPAGCVLDELLVG